MAPDNLMPQTARDKRKGWKRSEPSVKRFFPVLSWTMNLESRKRGSVNQENAKSPLFSKKLRSLHEKVIISEGRSI